MLQVSKHHRPQVIASTPFAMMSLEEQALTAHNTKSPQLPCRKAYLLSEVHQGLTVGVHPGDVDGILLTSLECFLQ